METAYLIGPITGNPLDFEWRDKVAMSLDNCGIRVLNPLRGKSLASISNHGLHYNGDLALTEMAERDYEDVCEASIAFAYIPYIPDRPMLGSLWELGIAHEQGKVIVITAHDKLILEHLFVRAFATARFDNLDSAVLYVIENYADMPA